MRKSIEPTYDSRETGPQYHVTAFVDDRLVNDEMHVPIPDPFSNTTVIIGWSDALKAALRHRPIKVSVSIGATRDRVEDVLELDDNYRGMPGSTRHSDFDESINQALRDLAEDERPERCTLRWLSQEDAIVDRCGLPAGHEPPHKAAYRVKNFDPTAFRP